MTGGRRRFWPAHRSPGYSPSSPPSHVSASNPFTLSKEAAWLAEYLHELTVFPKGKHDDQVDSTAQMLDLLKQASVGPTSNAGIWHLYKQRYEAQQAGLANPRRGPLSVMARTLGRCERSPSP